MIKNFQDFLGDESPKVRAAMESARNEEELVEAARQLGYEFTVEQMREHFSHLSDEDMENVSGGTTWWETHGQFHWRGGTGRRN